MLSTVTALLSFAALAVAHAKPTPPSQDSWYAQPANISDYARGAMIRSRQVDNNLQPFLPLPVDVSVESVHQYLYRTTDSHGNAVAAATTLIVPHNSDPSKLLGFMNLYDSANLDCSPSYTLRHGSSPGGLVGALFPNSTFTADTPFLAAALNQGWWVMTPDYEGLKAQFTAGVQSGQAALDSFRVVLDEAPRVGLSPDPRYTMWGYSGGAIAAGWAAELQPSYAPELNFSGVAMGGVVADLGAALRAVNGMPASGVMFASLAGLGNAYSNVSEWLDESLVPAHKERFFKNGNSCLVGLGTVGSFQDLKTYFANGVDALKEAVPASVLRVAGQMGHRGTPQAPLYVYMGEGDENAPVEYTNDLVQKYCQNGATIEYHRDILGMHVSELVAGSANALGWLKDRLDGKEVSNQGKCVTKEVVITEVKPSIIALFGEELWSFLTLVLGGKLAIWT